MTADGHCNLNKISENQKTCRQADFEKMNFANTQHVMVDATHQQPSVATSAGLAGASAPFQSQLWEQSAGSGAMTSNPATALPADTVLLRGAADAEAQRPANHQREPQGAEAVPLQASLEPATGKDLAADPSGPVCSVAAVQVQQDGLHSAPLAPPGVLEDHTVAPAAGADAHADQQGSISMAACQETGALDQQEQAAPLVEEGFVGGLAAGGLGSRDAKGGCSRTVSQSPPLAAESDPFAEDDKRPSPGASDSDVQFSEDDKASQDADSDYVFSDEEEERKKKRWLRPTPEGARRSKRLKDEVADGAEGQQRVSRRQAAQETSTAQPSRTASDDYSEAIVSPLGTVVKRELTQEEVDADVKVVQGMWEMASVLDFLRKFKPQLKLSRDFGADELERVLVTSAGDGGLLADVHIDLMRGISPKNEVNPANWAVHLANKIKYHWKNLADGTPCPFKPEKYFEAVTYATLPSQQRVRTLNYLCCIRADKEDIQERMMAAENPRPAPKPAAPPRPPRPVRGQAPPPEPVEETLDTFRREPTGTDASGITYYFFEMSDSIGFRLYREIPAELVPANRADNAGKGCAAAAADLGAPEKADAAGGTDNQPDAPVQAQKQGPKGRGGKRKKVATLVLPPPPPAGKWELVASSLPELQSVGERLTRSMKPQDKELGKTITDKAVQLVSDLEARQEAEDRRARAERRVQKKLGVDVQAEFGRARRERRNINYAFTDYDDVIRSAIKRSSRRDESPEEGGRRRRAPSPPKPDPVAEAQRGLRRGRSAAAIHEDVSMGDLSERQLRLLARSRSASGVSDTHEPQEDEHEPQPQGHAGHDEWREGRQGFTLLPGAGRQWASYDHAQVELRAQPDQEAWDPAEQRLHHHHYQALQHEQHCDLPQHSHQLHHHHQQHQQYYQQLQQEQDMYRGYSNLGKEFPELGRQQYVQVFHQDHTGQEYHTTYHNAQQQGMHQESTNQAGSAQHNQQQQQHAGRRGAAKRRVFYDQYEEYVETGEDAGQVSDDEYDPRND